MSYTGLVFSLNGRRYPNLKILEYEVLTDVIDGTGAGRTQEFGLKMFRQPRGTFKNLNIKLGRLQEQTPNSDDYMDLINHLNSFGYTHFHSVSFMTSNGVITQNMYLTRFREKLIRIYDGGVSFWQTATLEFRAERTWKGG